jgi:phytoene dehydrogenase-like protein
VRLESGETLDADVVLSSCDPRNTLLHMVDKRELPPVLETRALAWRARGTTAVVRLALSGPLVFRGRPDELVERAVLGSDLDGLERSFDPVKYGELPDAPCLELSVPSLSSPELAPDGQHVVCIQVHFVPHALKGGWSDARRDDLKQRVLATLARFAENIPEQILGCEVLHPVDIERRYGITGGHIHHGEQALDQALHQRPNPECSRHATPIAGLFLCGSGTHPGGGLTGAPGALAARAALEAGS